MMKKDMGGAAHALALGRMVMAARLPVRLAVLLPVVENAIAGDAMRPGDVLASRKGLTIEVGNTDAEGRLILADALARAAELEPDLTIDLATLTGAARAALGPEIAPFYTDDDALAGAHRGGGAGGRATRCGACRCGRGYDAGPRQRHRRPEERSRRLGAGRLGHRRALPASGSRRPAPGPTSTSSPGTRRGRPGWPAGAEAQAIRALFRCSKPATHEPAGRAPDPRLTLARTDLAAASLEGIVAAGRYEPSRPMRVTAPARRRSAARPTRPASAMDELLYGEAFEALADEGGFVWGQARRDGYVGFVPAAALAPGRRTPTHRVAAIRTYAFAEPSIKRRPAGRSASTPSSGSRRRTARSAAPPTAAGSGWNTWRRSGDSSAIRPWSPSASWVRPTCRAAAPAPASTGPALIQQALYACGRACPRDADQQWPRAARSAGASSPAATWSAGAATSA